MLGRLLISVGSGESFKKKSGKVLKNWKKFKKTVDPLPLPELPSVK